MLLPYSRPTTLRRYAMYTITDLYDLSHTLAGE